jgi:hypothetical protein
MACRTMGLGKWRSVSARRLVSPGRLSHSSITRSGVRLGRRLYPYVIAGALLEPWFLSSSWSWLKRLSWCLCCVALVPKVSSDTLTFSNPNYLPFRIDSCDRNQHIAKQHRTVYYGHYSSHLQAKTSPADSQQLTLRKL